MPILPIEWDIDPEMVDLLIKKEQEEQNEAQERPFLQLPTPNTPNLPELAPKNDEKDDDDGVIIIDLQTTYIMRKLLKEWKNYLNEVEGNWEYRIMLRLDNDASLYGDLFEKIRAIPGVTIVKTEEKQQKISGAVRDNIAAIWNAQAQDETIHDGLDRDRNLWNLYNAATQHITRVIEPKRFEQASRLSGSILSAFDRAATTKKFLTDITQEAKVENNQGERSPSFLYCS